MSLGCPLVATAVGGIPEMITDKRNGILVPSQDVNAMTAACEMLLNDPALAARLGRQAWQDCRDLYAPENIAQQTIAGYEQASNKFRIRGTR
jgi:glycosyltransferase involved in cell wall biosynthesis